MPYNIVVLIKQIPDLELVKVNQSTGEPILEGVPYRFENLSKNAVEEAVRIKEKNGGKVTAVLFGNDKGTQVMKEAYAMGVDEGYVITGYQDGNTSLTSKVLAAKISQLPHDLVILGNQSADSMSGLLGGKLAAILGIPYLSNALKVEASGQKVKVWSAGESENIEMEADLPAVISVTQEINEPRFPPVMQIIQAGRKKINMEQSQMKEETGVNVISRIAPKSERKKIIFEDLDKGAQEVAKVIKEVAK
ncbi:MAG: electron transfer flavoprotein subunit beta/FixA family protein [Thermoplasmatales archaeon]